MRAQSLLLLFSIGASDAFVQAAQAQTATVYLYRLHYFTYSARKLTLSLDGRPLAYLDNGRYWAFRLPVGEHVLTDKNPVDYIKFQVAAGGVYYIRGEFTAYGMGRMHARFVLENEETGAEDVRRLKFGDLRMIHNHEIILVKP